MGKEKSLQDSILLEFGALPGLRIWRCNTGKAYGYSVVKNALCRIGAESLLDTMPLTKYGTPGSADIQGIGLSGRAIAIECKSPHGVQDPRQKAWQQMFTSHGGLYILARQEEEVARALRLEGMLK